MIEDRTQPWRRKILPVMVRTVEAVPKLVLVKLKAPEIEVGILKEGHGK